VLREYASDRLREADAVDDTMAQLVDHYVATAPAKAVLMQRGGAMIADLEFDYPNLDAAMEWSLSAGLADEMVRVVFALWPVWFNGDRAVESAAWVRQADEVLSSPEADWLQGFFAFQFGDMETASARLLRALNRFEEAGDRQGVAMAQTFAGALTPDPAVGEALLSEAQAYFDGEGQLLGRYLAGMMISVVAVAAGDLERALVLRRELLPAAEEYGYDTVIGWTHWNIATVLIGLGRTEEAAGHNALAFSMLSAYGYQEGIGSAGEVEAIIAVERGDPARTAIIHGGCRRIFERLGIEVWWEVGPLIEEATASAREQLGETEYERLFAQGKALTLDELVEVIDSGLGGPAAT
jgi:tetratricopeptide (TPR) repeat protein